MLEGSKLKLCTEIWVKIYSQNTQEHFSTTCLLFKLPGKLCVARKRTFNSTNDDQVFLQQVLLMGHPQTIQSK